MDMPELEVTKKTCMECGTKSDPLVLVCPSCTSVLPDGEMANVSETFAFPPEPLIRQKVQENTDFSSNAEIFRIAVFFIGLAVVILYLSLLQK